MLSKDSDLEKETAGWQLSKSKKKRKGTRKQVMVATRTSSRVPRDRISIATKAANRIKALNDTAGTSSKNPFTILNNTSNDAMGKVIIDLDIEVEDLEEQLDVFRVEENARAAIAEANYKSFLEKQKFRDAP